MLNGINLRLDIAEEKIIEFENMCDSSTKSGKEDVTTFWYKILHYKWNGIYIICYLYNFL